MTTPTTTSIEPVLDQNSEATSFEVPPTSIPPLSVSKSTLLQLSILEVVSLTYVKGSNTYVEYFSAGENKSSFFDEETRTFKLINYFTETEQYILESDLIQIEYPSSEQQVQEFYENVERRKLEYKHLLKEYESIADLTNIHQMSKEEAYSVMYGLSVSQLQNITICRSVVIKYITAAIDREVKNLTDEFSNLDASDELQKIIKFLNAIKGDFSIFRGAMNYEQIMSCWPAVLSPSFFSTFQNYTKTSHR